MVWLLLFHLLLIIVVQIVLFHFTVAVIFTPQLSDVLTNLWVFIQALVDPIMVLAEPHS